MSTNYREMDWVPVWKTCPHCLGEACVHCFFRGQIPSRTFKMAGPVEQVQRAAQRRRVSAPSMIQLLAEMSTKGAAAFAAKQQEQQRLAALRAKAATY